MRLKRDSKGRFLKRGSSRHAKHSSHGGAHHGLRRDSRGRFVKPKHHATR